MSKKIIPLLLELRALSKFRELTRQNGFDVLLISRQDHPESKHERLDCIRRFRMSGLAEMLPPELVRALTGEVIDVPNQNQQTERAMIVFDLWRPFA